MGSEPQFIWYHVIWNTLSSWLPGDPRGFRNRDHRIHSSGDYKNPPPLGEHAGLFRYNQHQSRPKVIIPHAVRPFVNEAVRDAMNRRGVEFVVVSVSDEHVHTLVLLSEVLDDAQTMVGKIKTGTSFAVREQMPGTLWSRGCTLKLIVSDDHWASTFQYIAKKQERGSYVWDQEQGGRYQT